MSKIFKAPAGTYDLLPEDHDFFTFLKKVIRHRLRQSGFRRVSVPTFEESEVFELALGMSSKIVQRELYNFEDRHKRKFSLRPEMTAGIVRAFIEHEMYKLALPVELYYIGRCFRFGLPKSNTQRAF